MSQTPIHDAFGPRKDLLDRIHAALARSPDLNDLFLDISQYVLSIQSAQPQPQAANQPEPASKKRKLDASAEAGAHWDPSTIFGFNEISFSIPQRKKMRLDIGQTSKQGIRAISGSGDVEVFIRWADVREVACLPVPEKAQAQYNFCVFPNSTESGGAEQILWTVTDTEPKEGSVGTSVTQAAQGTYKTILLACLNKAKTSFRKAVTLPSDAEFVSQLPQQNRPGETPYHIKAFRGAKEGYLFLLSTGIVWGFKKPLEFFPFDVIESVSYTSVLQRTFNLNVAIQSITDGPSTEFEFSMVDQAEFAGIDAYVKRHNLQDASMAEQRRAKRLNINGVKAEGEGQPEEGENGELAKAAREAEQIEDDDDDDEEDENFDPGSAGQSEGEGSSSDEEGLPHRPHEQNGNDADDDSGDEE